MPAADELFRPTGAGGITGPALSAVGSAARAPRPGTDRLRAVPDPIEEDPGYQAEGYAPDYDEAGPQDQQPRPARVRSTARPRGTSARGASGRERHDEKITVYVSPEELLALEQARIMLRAQHGLAVDRGRLVREAIDLVLADFDQNGEGSLLVESLRGH